MPVGLYIELHSVSGLERVTFSSAKIGLPGLTAGNYKRVLFSFFCMCNSHVACANFPICLLLLLI